MLWGKRILQGRLQILAEVELPESQCGFRKSRSCADMIFTVCQLVEKSWEHMTKSFVTFIDLKKAYDSVPRNVMWLASEKLGVPEDTINLIHSFHQGMKVRICLDGALLEELNVENGLRQGCCIWHLCCSIFTLVSFWSDGKPGWRELMGWALV